MQKGSDRLRLYSTLAKREIEFTSQEEERTGKRGLVTMYTCGPTVYGRPHIGNYSSFLMADLLRRWLTVSGYEVKHVKNITDVGHLVADSDQGEDKVEAQARAEKLDPLAIARKYAEQYLEDEGALNMLEPTARPRATETIPEMIAMIAELVKRGIAYETEDGVYFSVAKFPAYGELSGNTLANLSAGKRIEVNEVKRDPFDFALWKKCVGENAQHILRWASPWGEGFPGWHIECSAMSKKFLGEAIDLHTGGEDNIFPHHESEIAQSEAVSGKPFARYWLHRRRIAIGEEKMSKSLGNVFTLPDIVARGFDPLDLRYYLLSVHYRTNLKFTWKGLDDARKARRKVLAWMEEVGSTSSLDTPRVRGATRDDRDHEWVRRFAEAMNDDLNTPEALGILFEAMNAFYASKPKERDEELADFRELSEIARATFGCFEQRTEEIPEEVARLLTERKRARDAKDFEASDQLRNRILSLGYEVKDLPEGQKARKL